MQSSAAETVASPPPVTRWIWITLAAVLLIGFLFRLNELGQPSIKDLDEAYHAIVARSMMHDPLRPMLYANPFLPYDSNNWLGNHIWLHKPPLALWQMAASMSFFGESNFSMRLPSLLLSMASVFLTFQIGRLLGDARAGLIAAAFQAFNPAVTQLVHGQVFSDHVDTALLFYCELSVWMLIRAAHSGSNRLAAISGLLMGLGWLTKSFPATFVIGLAAYLWIAPRFTTWPSRFQITRTQLALFTTLAIAVCIPWVAWCFYAFPREYWYEQVHVFRHLNEDIETFGHPWDRLVFDYLLRVLLDFYPLVICAGALLAIDSFIRRDRSRVFVFLWIAGVFIPHLLATSKTPSATLIGWPALWLAAGLCVSDALRGRAIALGVVLTAGVLILRPFPDFSSIDKKDVAHFGAIMLSQWRTLVEIAIVLAGAGIFYAIRSRLPALRPRLLAGVVLLIFLFPVGRHLLLSYKTGASVPDEPVAFNALGRFVREKAPPNAVFFVENLSRNEHMIAMWWFDRSCYPLLGDRFGENVNDVIEAGGIPFILSRNERTEAVLHRVPGEGTLYRLDQTAPAAGNP